MNEIDFKRKFSVEEWNDFFVKGLNSTEKLLDLIYFIEKHGLVNVFIRLIKFNPLKMGLFVKNSGDVKNAALFVKNTDWENASLFVNKMGGKYAGLFVKRAGGYDAGLFVEEIGWKKASLFMDKIFWLSDWFVKCAGGENAGLFVKNSDGENAALFVKGAWDNAGLFVKEIGWEKASLFVKKAKGYDAGLFVEEIGWEKASLFVDKTGGEKAGLFMKNSGGENAGLFVKKFGVVESVFAVKHDLVSKHSINFWLKGFDKGLFSENIFRLFEVFENHPSVRKYKKLIWKKELSISEKKELSRLFGRFERLAIFLKKRKFDWRRHGKPNKLFANRVEEILEKDNPAWNYKDSWREITDFNKYPEELSVERIGLDLFFGSILKLNTQKLMELNKLLKKFSGNGLDFKSLKNGFVVPNKRVLSDIRKSKLSKVKRLKRYLVEFLKVNKGKEKALLSLALPLLARDFNFNGSDEEKLRSLQEFFSDFVPHFLQENGLDFSNPFGKELKSIGKLLRLKRVKGIERVGFRLSPAKTWMDRNPGATSETCLKISNLGDFKGKKLHFIQIINEKTGTNEGTIAAATRVVNGEKYLILVGFNPKKRLMKKVNVNQLYSRIMIGLTRMARKKGYQHIVNTDIKSATSNINDLKKIIQSKQKINLIHKTGSIKSNQVYYLKKINTLKRK